MTSIIQTHSTQFTPPYLEIDQSNIDLLETNRTTLALETKALTIITVPYILNGKYQII